MPLLPPSFSKASHTARAFFFLAASQLKAKKLNPFQKDKQFLKYCTIVTWKAWFHALPAKGSKGFSFRTKHPANSRSSRHNSPGKALHDGVKKCGAMTSRSRFGAKSPNLTAANISSCWRQNAIKWKFVICVECNYVLSCECSFCAIYVM